MASGFDDLTDEQHRFIDARGEEWTFARRRGVRRSEEDTHIAVVARSAFQSRIVTCHRDEWETPRPDLSSLLARSVPAGGSRANPGPARPGPAASREPTF